MGNQKAQLKSKEATLAAEEAKTEIKTSINAEGNAEFVTHSGIKIVTDTNKGGHQTWVYNPAGEQIMHIHGDPHVNMLKDADGNNGDDFHFGDDSTLKFEDGTELTFNTTETGENTGIFYTTGIYVRAGDNVMHTGEATAGGARRTDIAQVGANSYGRMGADEDGAVMMGLKGDGQILMQTGNQWNELKDESWDGYLEDKTFGDQKGAAVEFKPETIMTGDQISAIKLEITQLESKEAEYQADVAKYTPLKSAAESNLESANSDLAKYEAMDDTEFQDNDSTRKGIEQKSLDLTRRANNLGVFMAGSDLVNAGDFSALGVDHGDMINAATDADRSWRMNEIDYNDKGLEYSDVRNDATAQLIAGLANLAEVSDFEEKSVENDQLADLDNLPDIKSNEFTNNNYDITNDFANQWVNNLGKEPSVEDLAYLTLMKTFDSEEMVKNINENSQYFEMDGKKYQVFKVDGTEYSLEMSKDTASGQSSVAISSSKDDYEFTMHHDSNYENGLSFGENFTDEFGEVRRTWSNPGDFISQKKDENGNWVDSAAPITKSLREAFQVGKNIDSVNPSN